jgi:uncharacterized protein YdaU (DUF1376 family)
VTAAQRVGLENEMPSAKQPSPAFQFYPDQFMADTAGLSAQERGAFLALACSAWRHGRLPAEEDRLRRIACVPEADWPDVWKAVGYLCFRDGAFWNIGFIDEARKKQEKYRAMQSEKGRKGGRPPAGKPAAKPMVPTGKPRPSSSSSPSGRRKAHPAGGLPQGETHPAGGLSLPEQAPRAEFIQGWSGLFASHRDGAKYSFEGAKDGAHVNEILKLAGGNVQEALRRAEVHLTDPFWSDRGANLGTLRSQWNRCVHGEGSGNGHAPLPRAMQALKEFKSMLDQHTPEPPK